MGGATLRMSMGAGTLVWGRLKSYPFWPARVEKVQNVAHELGQSPKITVRFLTVNLLRALRTFTLLRKLSLLSFRSSPYLFAFYALDVPVFSLCSRCSATLILLLS